MTIPPSSPTLMKTVPALEIFLKDISVEDSVGPFLRYDPLYDEIRMAKQEDDPRLSMGIWKTDLKKANWGIIENLCIEALTTRSKDLQLAAWLTEAWTSLYGLEGFQKGIQLLSGLLDVFWKGIHPQPLDDDMESRLMIFEWMDTALSSRLMLVPLTNSKHEQSSHGLGFFKSAQHSDASQKRVQKPVPPSRLTDPSKIPGTVEEFQKSLNSTPEAYLSLQQKNIIEAIETTQSFKNFLVTLVGAASPTFSKILGTLKEMEHLLSTHLQSLKPPPAPPMPETESTSATVSASPSNLTQTHASRVEAVAPPPPITQTPTRLEQPQSQMGGLKTRGDAYHQLAIIATFLEEHDPQSFAPQLLRQLGKWQNKNIIDIFGEIAKTPQELDILMKLLGSSLLKK